MVDRPWTDFESSFDWLQSRMGLYDFTIEELYHYTDQTGLLGILKEQKVRATHVGYLNDRSEVEHAAKMIERHLKELKARDTFVNPGLLDWMILTFHGINAQMTELFVASFSSNPDSLPQWDRYSSDFGYAIGFDPYRLDLVNRISSSDVRTARLIRILYTDADKKRLISEMVTALLDGATAAGLAGFTTDTTGPAFAVWNTDFLQCSTLLLAGLKHEAYESEQEYRFVVTHNPKVRSNARPGRHGIVPFVDLEPRRLSQLPVTSVVVGPSHYPESARFAVLQHLTGTLGPNAVRNSSVPKRT
jgi:hypothetical protein